MELETTTPTIVTTSQLLTTGVDVQTCKNIVIARTINSMTEFKQIIGRGTRVRGRLRQTVFQYSGLHRKRYSPLLRPRFRRRTCFGDCRGNERSRRKQSKTDIEKPEEVIADPLPPQILEPGGANQGQPPRKYYVDQGSVEIVAHFVSELDSDGKQLRVVRFTDYTGEKVRSMCPSAAELRSKWSDAEQRAEIIQALEERGITLEELIAASNQPDADPFDLLCQVAYSAPIRTRTRTRRKGFVKNKKHFSINTPRRLAKY